MTTTFKEFTFGSKAAPRFLELGEAVAALPLPEVIEASESAAQQVLDYNTEVAALAATVKRWTEPIPVELHADVQRLVLAAAERRGELIELWRKLRFSGVLRGELVALLAEDLSAQIQKLEKHLGDERRDVENALAQTGHNRRTGMLPAGHLNGEIASRQVDCWINNTPRVRAVLARLENAKESRSEWGRLQLMSSALLAGIEAALDDELRKIAHGGS